MNLRNIREAQLLSQTQLAKKTGVTQGYISQIETGEKEPTVRLLKRIAEVLGVSPGELLTESDSEIAI